MTIIERAASAIYALSRQAKERRWEELDEFGKSPWMADVRAVLEAIREPSEEMVAGVVEAIWKANDTGPLLEDVPIIWQAMIDAILKEKAE